MRFLTLLLLLFASAAGAADTTGPAHGIAMHGDLKYGPGFTHFDYVNPDAPKGGELRLAGVGTFDSFNPFIIKGNPDDGAGRIYETLLVGSADEPFSEYGLLAESVETPAGSLLGAVHAASRGALARRQAGHRRGRDLDVRDVAQQGPAVLSRLLLQRRRGGEDGRADGEVHVQVG